MSLLIFSPLLTKNFVFFNLKFHQFFKSLEGPGSEPEIFYFVFHLSSNTLPGACTIKLFMAVIYGFL
jgi:hypothetical protein